MAQCVRKWTCAWLASINIKVDLIYSNPDHLTERSPERGNFYTYSPTNPDQIPNPSLVHLHAYPLSRTRTGSTNKSGITNYVHKKLISQLITTLSLTIELTSYTPNAIPSTFSPNPFTAISSPNARHIRT
ncbi:hypothetical protein J6590_040072 [Homalodisca vitripennis]|nr:hypothetical protein J6590_040072 [Homalodisca vitripennis]